MQSEGAADLRKIGTNPPNGYDATDLLLETGVQCRKEVEGFTQPLNYDSARLDRLYPGIGLNFMRPRIDQSAKYSLVTRCIECGKLSQVANVIGRGSAAFELQCVGGLIFDFECEVCSPRGADL